MKKLVYTTCDFSPNSYNCTELLYRTLTINNSNFDFYIVSNKNSEQSKFPIIVEDSPNRKVLANWKYTDLMPKGYDQYFYLDSDILCFGKLEDLCDTSDISLCSDKDVLMSDSEYYCYPYATPEEKIEMKKHHGFCAGSFGFKNLEFLSDIRNLIEPKLKNPSVPDGLSQNERFEMILSDCALDQTSLNYWIFKRLPDLKYYDFCDKTLIRPDDPVRRYTSDKILYHFCGFRAEMNSKYERMRQWCRYNNIEIE